VEFAIVGAVVIVLLAVGGIAFLPPREGLLQREKLLARYPDKRDARAFSGVSEESRSGGERNASRSGERAGELGEDRQVGVKRDPIQTTDP
jgi:hypothetical protein